MRSFDMSMAYILRARASISSLLSLVSGSAAVDCGSSAMDFGSPAMDCGTSSFIVDDTEKLELRPSVNALLQT